MTFAAIISPPPSVPAILSQVSMQRRLHVRSYYHTCIIQTDANSPNIAIQHSLILFSAHYAFVINDVIPANSQYKWLDMSGAGLWGDIDPVTGFLYEPRPFVDRVCDFEAPATGEQVVVVIDSWGSYDRHVYCK